MRKKKVTNKTKQDIKNLDIVTQLLECKLTSDELVKYGSELARTIQDIADEEEHQTSLKTELKARLAVLEAKRGELATKIIRGAEPIDVDVQPALDFKADCYRETRMDTGEVVYERKIKDDERQVIIEFKKV